MDSKLKLKHQSIDRLAFELLETNMEIQRLIHAYQDGYRGYIPENTVKELSRLISQAFILRKRMVVLRPNAF